MQQQGISQAEASQNKVRFHQAAVEDQDRQDHQDHQDDKDHQDNQVSKDRKDRRVDKDRQDRQDRRAGKDRQHQEACRDITRTEGTGNHHTLHYKHIQQLGTHRPHQEADPKR